MQGADKIWTQLFSVSKPLFLVTSLSWHIQLTNGETGRCSDKRYLLKATNQQPTTSGRTFVKCENILGWFFFTGADKQAELKSSPPDLLCFPFEDSEWTKVILNEMRGKRRQKPGPKLGQRRTLGELWRFRKLKEMLMLQGSTNFTFPKAEGSDDKPFWPVSLWKYLAPGSPATLAALPNSALRSPRCNPDRGTAAVAGRPELSAARGSVGRWQESGAQIITMHTAPVTAQTNCVL